MDSVFPETHWPLWELQHWFGTVVQSHKKEEQYLIMVIKSCEPWNQQMKASFEL